MSPTKEDFDALSPADFMDLVEAEHRDAHDWDALVRESDGDLPNNVSDAQLLTEYRIARAAHAHNRQLRRIVLALVALAIVATLLIACALPAGAHDLAAWSDPARDKWFRGLTVPGASTSCCNFTDAAAMNPDMVKQDSGGTWWVDLGAGFVPVPPERVITNPPSIDGLPYIFLMALPTQDSPNKIRCFVPSVGTY